MRRIHDETSRKSFHSTLCCSCSKAISVADAHANPARTLLQQLDTNKDGLISLKESVRHTGLLRNFGLIDDNEDGKLSEAELVKSELTPGNKKLTASE
ncbi:calcium-binding EF-hand protein [Alteromonas mediterranea 615]|uniref:Calcium-binding EF-hand protein n=1 Tax=Alteromonas mediterranea 615 TaxID=1300253 RepID=S5AFG6_9ALTE|nr:calcium-binding EF-hand protein [Alteromonas mediterranea 615]